MSTPKTEPKEIISFKQKSRLTPLCGPHKMDQIMKLVKTLLSSSLAEEELSHHTVAHIEMRASYFQLFVYHLMEIWSWWRS